jgi:hypothetical protein
MSPVSYNTQRNTEAFATGPARVFLLSGGQQVPERRVIPSVPDLCETLGLDASKKEAVHRKTLTFEDVVARPFFSRHALVRQNRVHENAGENLAPNADYTCCADILHCSIVALRHWVGSN